MHNATQVYSQLGQTCRIIALYEIIIDKWNERTIKVSMKRFIRNQLYWHGKNLSKAEM